MYQFKPSLKAMPETTKAILIGSCHEKCMKLLVEPEIGDPWIENLTETMTGGLTDRQGAGIPNMYRMISMVSQHTYGNGVLDSYNSYERYVKFLQPKYNSSNINISMAFLQTNVPSDTTSGMKDDIDISTTNNNSTISSSKGNSSTEMVYRSLTNDDNYTLRIYKYGGNSDSIRYGYAWSTDNERYYPNYEDEGVYYLKNYNSSYYLARNNVDNTAYQTNAINGLNSEWVLDCTSPSSHLYALKCGDILSNGLGLGSGISPNNYYALEGPNSMTSAITVQFNSDTGTYTFKRNVNGAVYALGINGQSTSVGAYANWLPYSANNKSQKWYLETVNYRPGDADYDGAITENDKLLVQQYLLDLYSITNNLQKNLFDANRDNSIDMGDVVFIAQITS